MSGGRVYYKQVTTGPAAERSTQSIDPLAAWLLGSVAPLPWVLVELCLERTWVVPAWLCGLWLGMLAGGLCSLLTCRLRTARALQLGLTLPPLVLGAPLLLWFLRRAVELRMPITRLWELLFCVAAAIGGGVLVWRMVRSWSLRWPVALGSALIVAVEASVLSHQWLPVVGIVVPVCIAAAGLALLYRWQSWWLAAAAAAVAVAVLHGIDPIYAELRRIVSVSAVGWSVLAARRATAGSFAPRGSSGLRLAAAAALLLTLAISGALYTRAMPVAFRSRVGAVGLSGALAEGLRALTDIDGDGYAVPFGQPDCAPFDPKISPGVHEQPGDGIDNNCAAGDPGKNAASWVQEHERSAAPPPAWHGDIVLVVVDTLRYDDAQAQTLPAFRELEAHGLAYDHAYSTASFTVGSLAGLLAERMPSAYRYHWASHNDAFPLDVKQTLLTRLQSTGYDVGLAGGVMLQNGEGIFSARRGFGRGSRVRELGLLNTSATETTGMALRVWQKLDPARPRFLYVHYMAIHGGLPRHEDYRQRLRTVDDSLGALRSAIPNALWVVTADHGESFGLHGHMGHSTTLYEEVLHVPLLLSWPGAPVGRIAAVTSLRALPSTVLAMVDPARAPRGDGPYFCVPPGQCRDAVALSALERPTLHLHSVIVGQHHLLHDLTLNALWAYDLASDPLEQHPLAQVPPPLAATLLAWEERLMAASEDSFWPYEPLHQPEGKRTMAAGR